MEVGSFFPLGQFPTFIAEGWIESIEFRNSLIVIRKAATPGLNKLGNRVVTGTSAAVNEDPLNINR